MRPHIRLRHWYALSILLITLLSGCAATSVPTYVAAQQTAAVAQCWSDTPAYPTPPPVTVTVTGPTSPLAVNGPTATSRPTTTPYPRCAPAPGATARVWPSAMPPPPPYPTMDARRWLSGSGLQTTINLPSWILDMDVAVHPSDNWPVVGAAVWSGDNRAEYAMVVAYNPVARRWMPAHQVDIGESALGRYTRSIRVGVVGQQTIVAVWGMSDGNLRTGSPPTRVWAATSDDFGASWSPPQVIGESCRQVNDLDTTTEGNLVVQLICTAGERSYPAMVVRTPDGSWLAPAPLPIPAWSFSPGTVTIVPGATPRVVSTLFSGVDSGMNTPLVYVMSADLASAAEPAAWTIAQQTVAADGLTLSGRMWHVRAALMDRPVPQQAGVVVSWTDAEAGHAMAMSSLDAGQTWGPIAVVMRAHGQGRIEFSAPAYDPRADALVTIWSCCTQAASPTHYGSWSRPDATQWSPDSPDAMIPLVLGSRAAADTDVARARGSRMVWAAWVEHQSQLHIRSIDLNTIIPVSLYR